MFAEVIEQSRARKILVFKKNRRKNYRRTRGHRQEQTVLRIIDVSPSGLRPKVSAVKVKSEKGIETKTADKKPVKKIEAKGATSVKEKRVVKKLTKKNPKSKE